MKLLGTLLVVVFCVFGAGIAPTAPPEQPVPTVQTHRFTLGRGVCDWIEQHCVYPRGSQIGQPFVLLPWQRDWINELYRCDDAGNLQYTWALLGIPKKNGKSTLVAALALYHLLGDPAEADPWVVVAAASDRQADIVFGDAKTMCELSPTLRDATVRFRWEIRPKEGHGKLERVAASAGKLDGKDISFLVIDELHEWQEENWTILTNGTVGRARSQIIQITTAGWDQETICYKEYEKGQKIAAGEVENPAYFFKWFGAPDGADHRDEAGWPLWNPSFGTLITATRLRDKLANVPESEFRRYFMNQWVASETLWLPPGAWDECNVGRVEFDPALPLVVGWDASTKYDSTALVMGQLTGGKVNIQAKIWERPLDPSGNPIEEWAIPQAEVKDFLRDLWRTRRWGEVKEIAFDPAFITWAADELGQEGLPMVEFPQTDANMVPATQAVYEAVIKREIAHDGDPVLARHIRSAVAVMSYRGGQRITKKNAKRKIDAAVALLMVVQSLRKEEEQTGISVYVGGA